MRKIIGSKFLYFGMLAIALVLIIFDYRLSIGLAFGTIFSFVDKELLKLRFSNLSIEGKPLVIRIVFGIFLKLALLAGCCFASYKLGGLVSYLTMFAAILIPITSFYILSLKGNK